MYQLLEVSPYFSVTIIFQVVEPHRFHYNLYEEEQSRGSHKVTYSTGACWM